MFEYAVKIYVPGEADLRVGNECKDGPKTAALTLPGTLRLVDNRANSDNRRSDQARYCIDPDDNQSFVKGYN